jgi:hypothetical protein
VGEDMFDYGDVLPANLSAETIDAAILIIEEWELRADVHATALAVALFSLFTNSKQ